MTGPASCEYRTGNRKHGPRGGVERPASQKVIPVSILYSSKTMIVAYQGWRRALSHYYYLLSLSNAAHLRARSSLSCSFRSHRTFSSLAQHRVYLTPLAHSLALTFKLISLVQTLFSSRFSLDLSTVRSHRPPLSFVPERGN